MFLALVILLALAITTALAIFIINFFYAYYKITDLLNFYLIPASLLIIKLSSKTNLSAFVIN